MKENTDDPATAAESAGLSREQLECVLDALPWVVTYWDTDSRLRYANSHYTTYLGREQAELQGVHISELMGPELYEMYTPVIEAVLAGERETFSRILTDAEGRESYVEAELIPHFEEGRVDGYVLVGMDATERIRSEHALAEAAKEVTLLQERQRVAEDLHDLVIQRLFAAGLDLAAAMREGPDMRERVQAAAIGVDKGIRELRGTIHHLRELMRPSEVPRAVATIIDDATRMLGFAPRLVVAGPWSDVAPEILLEMTAVLNESLANVARHAGATEVQVTVAREEGGFLVLRVADNGRGLHGGQRSSGVANMRSRAEKLGGSFELRQNSPRGTIAEWRVPVRP